MKINRAFLYINITDDQQYFKIRSQDRLLIFNFQLFFDISDIYEAIK